VAIIVIGGHSRDVGKTSVVAGLIAALPEHHWTAFKITQYGHGICSRKGKICHCACATADHSWAISEEEDRSGESDTSRFLRAGAQRAWWVRSEQGRLEEAMPTIARKLSEAENAIVESNSILGFLSPDLYLTVLDPATRDFKRSAREFLDLADAVILHDKALSVRGEGWGVDLNPVGKPRPIFRIQPPNYVDRKIVQFVKKRLQASSDHRP
jgi:hypothetical protein